MNSLKKLVMVPVTFAIGLVGCSTSSSKTHILTTTSYGYDASYIPYIVELNGEEVGGGLGTATKRSTVIPGPQYVKWGETNSHKKHKAINVPTLTNEELKEKKYLAVHLYPDDSVEITLSNDIPDATDKGLKLRSIIIDKLNAKKK